MKQIFQNLSTGEINIETVPMPKPGANQILIQSRYSLISPGTERMLLEFGRANLLQKAIQQPDKVKQVVQKIKADGLHATLASVRAKLDQPLPLGYCNVGKVIETGSSVWEYQVGDLVISNGGHANVVCVDRNLTSKVPDGVSLEEASFTVLASIALQGLRLANPTMGETFVVIGLGLIGLITCKLLQVNGVQVIAYDFDEKKSNMAKKFGVDAFTINNSIDPVQTVLDLTNGKGCDAVIIAAATSSDAPAKDAPKMCRQRGRVILVGVMDIHFMRSDFYQKEISFQVSCSYGPGRYDNYYEKKGYDYPEGFVRWTAQRNFEAILKLLQKKKITFSEFIDGIEPFDNAKVAYNQIISQQSLLGVLFKYSDELILDQTIVSNQIKKIKPSSNVLNIALIGAGQFSSHTLIPLLKKQKINLHSIVSPGGLKAQHEGHKHGFQNYSTDIEQVLNSREIDVVIIATPHSQHANLALKCLEAGKHVFVEKPLAVNQAELDLIRSFIHNNETMPVLMVGFNRRFSPLLKATKQFLANTPTPFSLVYLVNAGKIDSLHWTQDQEHGGRLIGEGCHFIDTARYLSGSPIKKFSISNPIGESRDTFSIQLTFDNNSIASIHYFSNGNKSYPKENIKIFKSGNIIEIDNFKNINTYGLKNFSKNFLNKQQKGHAEEISIFFESIRAGSHPIPLDELVEVSQITIDLHKSL